MLISYVRITLINYPAFNSIQAYFLIELSDIQFFGNY